MHYCSTGCLRINSGAAPQEAARWEWTTDARGGWRNQFCWRKPGRQAGADDNVVKKSEYWCYP